MLTRFLQRPDFTSFDIRVVVRSSEKAERLRKEFGVTPIVGSHDDLELMEKAAQEVDVVIAMVMERSFRQSTPVELTIRQGGLLLCRCC